MLGAVGWGEGKEQAMERWGVTSFTIRARSLFGVRRKVIFTEANLIQRPMIYIHGNRQAAFSVPSGYDEWISVEEASRIDSSILDAFQLRRWIMKKRDGNDRLLLRRGALEAEVVLNSR